MINSNGYCKQETQKSETQRATIELGKMGHPHLRIPNYYVDATIWMLRKASFEIQGWRSTLQIPWITRETNKWILEAN